MQSWGRISRNTETCESNIIIPCAWDNKTMRIRMKRKRQNKSKKKKKSITDKKEKEKKGMLQKKVC